MWLFSIPQLCADLPDSEEVFEPFYPEDSFVPTISRSPQTSPPIHVNRFFCPEWTPQCHCTPQHEVPVFRDTRDPRLPSLELFEGATELRPWRRPCGRPRKRSCDSLSSDGEASFRTPRGHRPGHMSKGNHLWEFVRDLLANPIHNPSLVRWEDQANGVFRFVQSEKVARLWGEKKNNKSMTYEKLSRAMRFCRSAGHFAQLPKSEQFPKKLCFKFGPKALKWRICVTIGLARAVTLSRPDKFRIYGADILLLCSGVHGAGGGAWCRGGGMVPGGTWRPGPMAPGGSMVPGRMPGRKLRGGKVTGHRETGRKETGRKGTGGKTTRVKERGVGETGGKEKGVGETGGKTTGVKERGVG
ncbi:hypothetical protein LSAT2_003051 [Lamellibrachia satsuma]|nr:hypothetical protein LSAT2_003051 [Lamellibrachia satsuma]